METVHDGAESAMFKQLFQNWKVQEQTVGLGIAHNAGRIGKKDLMAEYDAVICHLNRELP